MLNVAVSSTEKRLIDILMHVPFVVATIALVFTVAQDGQAEIQTVISSVISHL